MLNNIKNCTEKVRKSLVYLEVSLRITYLCTRYFKGVPYCQAEIIPIEPETGNAETGTKRNQQLIPLFSLLTQKV